MADSSTVAGSSAASRGSTWHIVTFVYFTFICYLSIGLPLAVLPAFVHFQMGYSAMVAGLVISIQFIATLSSRPWAGRISDRRGAKLSVLWGMAACTCSGVLLLAAGLLQAHHHLSLSVLILSRLALGIGESLGSTGSTLWGISAAGQEHTAKVISFNGISTYGAQALGAPLGVVLANLWGIPILGAVIILFGTLSFVLALCKSSVPVHHGEHLPIRHLIGRVTPHGLALALGGTGYATLAAFVTLFYLSRHWSGAALCLTAFGFSFILARLLFIETITRHGGFPVTLVSLAVEAIGFLVVWLAATPWMALAGAALAGFGFSLVFPALGVEAVRRVPLQSRGTALGVFTAFADVSFFLVGPIAGAVIGAFGYRSVFLFALISVLAALGIAVVLAVRMPLAYD